MKNNMNTNRNNKIKYKVKYVLSVIIMSVMLLSGCSSGQSSETAAQASTASSATTAETIAQTLSTASTIAVNTEYKAKDLEVGYEDTTATHITLNGNSIEVSGEGADSEGSILTISDEGTYVITGTLEDGQILVDAEDTDKVQIVLNGVSITCSDNAPIYIKSADKVYITLGGNTENTLTDGTEYIQSDDNTVDGVIFSKADLTINGEGSLNITGNYQNGIVSKDDLVITGGTFTITAVKDAINGKDCVKINGGSFTLSAATGNGIQSKNGEDSTQGYVYISGGDITIINCKEGIEGTAIIIEGGNIDVTAEDDGFNAASGDTTDTDATDTADTMGPGGAGGGAFENDTNCYISITGGTIHINASGDGIDSNGSLYVSGGTTYVSGPTNSGNGALDYNGTAEITGGTIIATGSTGMAQGFSEISTQYSLLYNLSAACEAGTEVILTDSEGNAVASFTPDKEYQSVVISTSGLAQDATYTLTCGDQTADITLSSIVTSNGQQSGMDGQGGFGGGQMPQGGKQGRDNNMTPPDMGTASPQS